MAGGRWPVIWPVAGGRCSGRWPVAGVLVGGRWPVAGDLAGGRRPVAGCKISLLCIKLIQLARLHLIKPDYESFYADESKPSMSL